MPNKGILRTLITFSNFIIQERLTYLKKAASKISRANEDIQSTMKQISELEPLLTNAKSQAFLAEKQMKEAQEIYVKIMKECEEQSEKIKNLRVPYQQIKQETVQDFEQVCLDLILIYIFSTWTVNDIINKLYILEILLRL